MAILKGLSMNSYNEIVALRSSDLKTFLRSPAHYKYKRSAPREDNPAFAIGTAMHTLLLEPENFKEDFIIYRAHKTRCQAFYKVAGSHPDKTTLLETEYDQVNSIAEAVRSKSHVMDLIKAAEVELSVTTTLSGVFCKCRADGWIESENTVIDVKTTSKSAKDFKRAIYDFGYNYQNAFYEMIMDDNELFVKRFIFIVIEKEPPHEVRLVTINRDAIEKAKKDIEGILPKFKDCMTGNIWPGYSTEIEEITI